MKTIKYNSVLIILSLILLSNECKDDMDCRMNFINNSNETQWFDIVCYDYSGTEIWEGNCYDVKVSANSSKKLCSNETWEHVFSVNNTDSITIYVTNYKTASSYDMEKIIKNQKFHKKYRLSFDDLEDMNWTITYP
jgi:hypothetical protein